MDTVMLQKTVDESFSDKRLEECVNSLEKDGLDSCYQYLNAISEMLDKEFHFDHFSLQLRKRLVKGLCDTLTSAKDGDGIELPLRTLCLTVLRIFGRDKILAVQCTNDKVISMLMRQCGYTKQEKDQASNRSSDSNADNGKDRSSTSDTEVQKEFNAEININNGIRAKIEAQKCLCNLIFHCSTALDYFIFMNGLQLVSIHFRQRDELQHEMKLYDLRLLFLLTALRKEQRNKLWKKFQGIQLIVGQILSSIHADTMAKENTGIQGTEAAKAVKLTLLSDDCMVLISESLRVLFNVTLAIQDETWEKEDLKLVLMLIVTLRKFLINIKTDRTVISDFQRDIVNLFVNIPPKPLSTCLILPLADEDTPELRIGETSAYNNYNMIIILGLMRFLESRISQYSQFGKKRNQKDSLEPILSLLTALSRINRDIRKYLKMKILPPQKDFAKRPEEGTSLKSRLITLMTGSLDVKHHVGSFLFVLCKENSDRFVKHTGYGNAAGTLLTHGLLTRGQAPEEHNYSSEDEDSDTEEYKAQQDKIDPVTGAIKADTSNIFEGMSNEEIEAEAEHLFSLFKKLNEYDIIKPVDQAGRPIRMPDPDIFKRKQEDSSDSDN